jgi:hypothetical protein
MRMLLSVSIPVETGNAAAKAGTLGSTVERILAGLNPEAAYLFADDDGQRSGSIVFDMKDASQIPAIAEPWFLAFNAKISLRPVMNPQDLAAGGPSIGKAAQQYGKSTLLFDQGSGVTLKSRGRMLPFRSQGEVIPVWHFHLRQTLGVHDFVLSDDPVLVEEIGSQRVHLIGL